MTNMTHYMELLASNQPWNLIIFMAIPVILAETLAITEFFILFKRPSNGGIRAASRVAGVIAGPYFLAVFVYLFFNAVIPLTLNNDWRGPFDVIAVTFYLSSVVLYVGITLLELNILGKNFSSERKMKLHVIFISIFLVVAHIAMIFGMLDPSLSASVATEHSGMKM